MLQNSSILENTQFGRVGGCCYGYCDKFFDSWIKLSALITVNCLISLSDYNPMYTIMLVKNKAVNAPIRSEKIVMVMITAKKRVIKYIIQLPSSIRGNFGSTYLLSFFGAFLIHSRGFYVPHPSCFV